MYRVRPSAPPSMHAKHPRSTSTVARTSPPSRHADTAPVRDVGVPDRALGVAADAVRHAVAEVRPHAAAGEPAAGTDVPGREARAVGLGQHEGRAVRRDRDAVGERDAVGHLAHRAAGRHARHQAGRELRAREVEAGAADVRVAARVHHDVVPRRRREPGQVGVGDDRAVGLVAQQQALAPRHDEQAPVGEEVEAERQRGQARHDLGLAGVVEREDLARSPVRQPQPAVVPARRLAHDEPVLQRVHVRETARDARTHPVGP